MAESSKPTGSIAAMGQIMRWILAAIVSVFALFMAFLWWDQATHRHLLGGCVFVYYLLGPLHCMRDTAPENQWMGVIALLVFATCAIGAIARPNTITVTLLGIGFVGWIILGLLCGTINV